MRKLNEEEKERVYNEYLEKAMSYITDGLIIPPQDINGLCRWIVYGIAPGSFLKSVITNDLRGAFSNADIDNMHNLFAVVSFMYNKAPAGCWGSEERMQKWEGLANYMESPDGT